MLVRDDIIELYCVVIVPDILARELFIELNCELNDVFIELSDELMPDTWLAVARPVLTVNAEKSILVTPETFPSTITEYTPVE